jgi:hypothetical protein
MTLDEYMPQTAAADQSSRFPEISNTVSLIHNFHISDLHFRGDGYEKDPRYLPEHVTAVEGTLIR